VFCFVWFCFLQNGVRHTAYRRLFSTAPVLAGKQVYVCIWITLWFSTVSELVFGRWMIYLNFFTCFITESVRADLHHNNCIDQILLFQLYAIPSMIWYCWWEEGKPVCKNLQQSQRFCFGVLFLPGLRRSRLDKPSAVRIFEISNQIE